MFSILKKRTESKIYALKIFFKKLFVKTETDNSFFELKNLEKDLVDKDEICVLASGPSSNKLNPSKNAFYLVTNDSYRLVMNYDFLYYVNDGFFYRRFIANIPLCKKHQKSLFMYRKEDSLHQSSFQFFKETIGLVKEHDKLLLTNFKNDFNSSNENFKIVFDFLRQNSCPIKIQNSGVFLLLFGFYLAETYKLKLSIYGLDLGVGGKIHFERGGHVGKSITNDRVKANTLKQLELMYDKMGERIKNYSNFNSNT